MISNITVFITAPNEEEAGKIAKTLVEERLAACVNIIKDIRSIYRWKGRIEDDREVFMIVKTQKDLFKALSTRIKEIHSYDVPEIIALPIIEGSRKYMQWIKDSTK